MNKFGKVDGVLIYIYGSEADMEINADSLEDALKELQEVVEESKKVKVVITKDALEDVKDLSQEEKDELNTELLKLENMSIEEIMEQSKPVDMEELKEEDPELYKKVITRRESIDKEDKNE